MLRRWKDTVGRQVVEVGKEWEMLEGVMTREDWVVGEGIKVAFSCPEEFYELTDSVRMDAYGKSSRGGEFSITATFDSIRFFI